MGRLVTTVGVVAVAAVAGIGSASGGRQADVLLATVEVPFASAEPARTALNLDPGVVYTFEISGFGEDKPKTQGTNSSYAYDAVYCFRSAGLAGADFCSPPTRRGQALVVITPGDPDGVDFEYGYGSVRTAYSDSHVYRVKMTGLQGIARFVNERARSGNGCRAETRVCTGGFTVKVFGPEGGAPKGPTGAGAILATGGSGVKVQKAAGGWETASAGISLAPGDKIHTGFRSTVVIRLPDGHSLALHPLSMLLIQEHGYVLRSGEVEAQVGRRGRASSDFSVKTATTALSSRGTVFSTLYDPRTRTTVAYLKSGSIVATPNGRPAITMKPGQELEITPRGVSKGTYDRAGTPAGVIGRRKATALVLAALKRAEKSCQLDASTETGLVSLAHIPGGWRATATLSGPASKLAVWTITRSTLKPVSADAFEIDNRCR